MALKMDRQVDSVELGYFLNEVAEPGVIVSVDTAGSGIAMESPASVATVAAVASGSKPIGMLMNEFVSVDRTRQPINWHKDQAALGDKATIMTKGWAVTNKVQGTPSGGMVAALGASGNLVAVAAGTANTTLVPVVGRFRSGVNAAGYAKVYIDL